MTWRPFRLLGESSLRQAQQLLEQAVAGWERHWGGQLSRTHCQLGASSCVLPHPHSGWLHWQGPSDHSVWIRPADELIEVVSQLLFNAPKGAQPIRSPLADSVSQHAISDLFERLSSAFAGESCALKSAQCVSLPSEIPQAGSGALTVSWHIPGTSQATLVCFYAPVHSLHLDRRSLPPLAKLMSAASKHTVQLAAVLGRAELSIGQLDTLGVGDVVRLDKSIQHSLDVISSDGHLICYAHPGQRQQRMVVELTSKAK